MDTCAKVEVDGNQYLVGSSLKKERAHENSARGAGEDVVRLNQNWHS